MLSLLRNFITKPIAWLRPSCCSHRTLSYSGHLVIKNEIVNALSSGKPVVALESTIISHGMPYPQNVRMAKEVEQIIRHNGSIPATIAILHGKVMIGLNDEQIEQLAQSKDVIKVSRRDISAAITKGITGGTTISGTMLLSHMAGIDIFVSGGLGGVHRGGEFSMDISADLMELGRTPVTVVTSGVKSILDIGRTLEVLETHGVCVASFGHTKEFPAFLTSKSGYTVSYNIENVDEAAKLVLNQKQLDIQTGMLLAVPIPSDYEYEDNQLEQVIEQALYEADSENIQGKDVTPYVLKRVDELTEGKSVMSNIALVKNNAKIGSQIAKRLCELRESTSYIPQRSYRTTSRHSTLNNTHQSSECVVIGGTNIDTVMQLQSDGVLFEGITNRAHALQTFGGVGRNVADTMSRVRAPPTLLTILGGDVSGTTVRQQCDHMDWSRAAILPTHSTAQYTVVTKPNGEVFFGVGDLSIHDNITPEYVLEHRSVIEKSRLLILDGNIPVNSLKTAGQIANQCNVPVFYEPTDALIACKILDADVKLTFTKPNLNEFKRMYQHLFDKPVEMADKYSSTDELLSNCIQHAELLTQHIPTLFLSLGADGALLCIRKTEDNLLSHRMLGTSSKQYIVKECKDLVCIHMPVLPLSDIKSLSGAGDCASGVFLSRYLRGDNPTSCLNYSLLAAQLSAQSHHTVPDTLSQLA